MENVLLKKTDLQELVRAAEERGAKKNLPFVSVGRDYQEEKRQSEHVKNFLTALSEKDWKGLDNLRSAVPQYYTRANFNETTSTQGGALVPSFWEEKVYSTVEKYGIARSLAKLYPMRSKTEYLNADSAFTSAVIAESAAPTPQDSTNFFTQTALTAKRIAGAVIVTREQIQDASVDMIDYLTTGIARAIAKTEDEQFFNGDGTGSNFTGLIGTSGTTVVYQGGAANSGKTAFSNISWADLIRVRLAVNSTVGANAIFVCPQTVFGYLLMETGGSRPIWDNVKPVEFQSTGMAAIEGNTYLTPTGKKMVVVPDALFPSSAAGKASVIYGDFSEFGILGERKGLEAEIYRESYNGTSLSGTFSIALEMAERVAIGFPAPAAFGILKTSTT